MLNPLAIAHLGIARRPIVVALLGIWDELMLVLSAPAITGGGPDSSDYAPDNDEDNDEDNADHVSPSYDAYVKRINDQRAAEWIRDVEARTTRERPPPDLAEGTQLPATALQADAPSARLMDLAGAKAQTKQDAQPNDEDEDEIAEILAMVLVLADD